MSSTVATEIKEKVATTTYTEEEEALFEGLLSNTHLMMYMIAVMEASYFPVIIAFTKR